MSSHERLELCHHRFRDVYYLDQKFMDYLQKCNVPDPNIILFIFGVLMVKYGAGLNASSKKEFKEWIKSRYVSLFTFFLNFK